MNIHKWLGNRFSAKSIRAIVKVEAGEIADVESMLALLDGEKNHFGMRVALLSTDSEPDWEETDRGLAPIKQSGFPSACATRDRIRYYQVTVYRD